MLMGLCPSFRTPSNATPMLAERRKTQPVPKSSLTLMGLCPFLGVASKPPPILLRQQTGYRNDAAEPPQAADPAVPLSLYSTPVARGRCCGSFGKGRAMTQRKAIRWAAVALGVGIIVALSVFPPWHTVVAGNGWPKVDYRWFLSPPPPLADFPYRVDLSRLTTRCAVVVASLLLAVGCMELFRWIKRRREQ